MFANIGPVKELSALITGDAILEPTAFANTIPPKAEPKIVIADPAIDDTVAPIGFLPRPSRKA